MTPTISEHTLLSATRDQVTGNFLDGEVVILHLSEGVYYGLNAVGGRIWELLQEPTSPAQICQTLLEEYEVDEERCSHELFALLDELLARGLISVRNGAVH